MFRAATRSIRRRCVLLAGVLIVAASGSHMQASVATPPQLKQPKWTVPAVPIGVALPPPFHHRVIVPPGVLPQGIHPFAGRFPHQGWWWWGGHGGFGLLGTYTGPLIVGENAPIAELLDRERDVVASRAAAPPATPCDTATNAACALRAGDAEKALAILGVDRVGSSLTGSPLPTVDRRIAALALLSLGDVRAATAAMARAYADNPSLATMPINAADLLGGRDRMMLSRAVRFAHRDASANGWLLVAVIMQGQGRNERALAMLHRPGAVGIDRDTVRALNAALTGRPQTP